MSVCPSCGHRNQPGAKFCSECGLVLAGTRLPTYEERKVVTVLFADLLRRALSFFRSVDATRFIREAEALLASPI